MEGEGGDSDLNNVVRNVSRLETEIEITKQKITDIDRQIKSFKESTAESQTALTKLEKDICELDKQISSLTSSRDDLSNDLKEAETIAFKNFLNKLGVNSLTEYEASRSNNQVKVIND